MDTNTLEVVNSFGSKLDAYISTIASKAGVAADHFYPVFVRQQMIEGVVFIGQWLLIAVIFVMLIKCFNKNIVLASGEDTDVAERGFVFTIISGVLIIVFGLVLFGGLTRGGQECVGKIFNPEYAAVKSLIEMVK